jgi:hypothetical protein
MLQKEIWPFELKTESALEPKMWTAEELNLLRRHNLDRQRDRQTPPSTIVKHRPSRTRDCGRLRRDSKQLRPEKTAQLLKSLVMVTSNCVFLLQRIIRATKNVKFTIRLIKSKGIWWERHLGSVRWTLKIKSEQKWTPKRPRRRWEDDITMGLRY